MNKFLVNSILIAVSVLIICYSIFRSWDVGEIDRERPAPLEKIIVDAQISGVNNATATSYTIDAKTLKQYSADQPSEIEQPRVHQKMSDESTRTITGDSAQYWPNEGKVVFHGNVVITESGKNSGKSSITETDTFTVHLKQQALQPEKFTNQN